MFIFVFLFFFFSSRRRHTRFKCDWSSDVCSSDLIRHEKWSTAEQLQVLDFRLNRRRLGPSERADGVVVFDRPPYKQSNEMLLLQVAESGAVDRPALAPIGFGVTSSRDEQHLSGK